MTSAGNFQSPYWTPEEDKALFEMRQRGEEYIDIAKKMGRSRGAVSQRYVRVRDKYQEKAKMTTRSSPNWKEEEIAYAMQERDKGTTYQTISAKLGRTVGGIKAKLSTLETEKDREHYMNIELGKPPKVAAKTEQKRPKQSHEVVATGPQSINLADLFGGFAVEEERGPNEQELRYRLAEHLLDQQHLILKGILRI